MDYYNTSPTIVGTAIDYEERKKRLVVGLVIVAVSTYLLSKYGAEMVTPKRKKAAEK